MRWRGLTTRISGPVQGSRPRLVFPGHRRKSGCWMTSNTQRLHRFTLVNSGTDWPRNARQVGNPLLGGALLGKPPRVRRKCFQVDNEDTPGGASLQGGGHMWLCWHVIWDSYHIEQSSLGESHFVCRTSSPWGSFGQGRRCEVVTHRGGTVDEVGGWLVHSFRLGLLRVVGGGGVKWPGVECSTGRHFRFQASMDSHFPHHLRRVSSASSRSSLSSDSLSLSPSVAGVSSFRSVFGLRYSWSGLKRSRRWLCSFRHRVLGWNWGMTSELRGFFDWCSCQTRWVSLLTVFMHSKNEALRWPSCACLSSICPPSGKFAGLSQRLWKSQGS